MARSIFGKSGYATNQDYALLRSKNYQYIYKIKSWLYDHYALTDKGIFKFSFLGYYSGRNRIYYADVILPKPVVPKKDDKQKKFEISRWVLNNGVEG